MEHKSRRESNITMEDVPPHLKAQLFQVGYSLGFNMGLKEVYLHPLDCENCYLCTRLTQLTENDIINNMQ